MDITGMHMSDNCTCTYFYHKFFKNLILMMTSDMLFYLTFTSLTFGVQWIWIYIVAPQFTSCMILDKLSNSWR